MKKLSLMFLAAVMMVNTAGAVTIDNHSFESTADSDYDGDPGEWSSPMGGIKHAATGVEFGAAAPDGDYVIFAYSGIHRTYQVLAETLAANTTYTLQMDILHRGDNEHPITSMLALGYGAGGPGEGTQLAGLVNGNTSAPLPTTPDEITTWNLTYETGDSHVGEGQVLWIELGARGNSSSGSCGYDNIRLTATTIASDFDPPIPNPASFAVLPYAVSDTTISMTATTGSDISGPVEYLFSCAIGDGNDSSWQISPSYTDTDLTPYARYAYTVTTRDSLGNTGIASDPASAVTCYVEGDLNADCKVDLLDFAELAMGWLSTYDMSDLTLMSENWLVNANCIEGDYNADCKVDLLDFAELAMGWLSTYDMSDLILMSENWLVNATTDSVPDVVGMTQADVE